MAELKAVDKWISRIDREIESLVEFREWEALEWAHRDRAFLDAQRRDVRRALTAPRRRATE